ncbi:unnamed protein product [Orchesella dallaii]|uniref:Uncharacterized protein n=1 Tax=Orchesella dallaii TaxID=48710 RepID=A0ABP1R5U9_9HEXA
MLFTIQGYFPLIETSFPAKLPIVFRTIMGHLPTCSVVLGSNSNPHETQELQVILETLVENYNHTIFLYGQAPIYNLTEKREIRQRTSYCKIAMFFLNNPKQDKNVTNIFSETFLELLSFTKMPILKRDKDYFMFVSDTAQLYKSFLSSETWRQIKYKIGFILETLQIISSCIFCEYSNSNIVELSLAAKTASVPELAYLYPDYTRDFKGYPLRVSASTKFPSVYEMKFVNSFWKHQRGLYADVFLNVQNKLNFTSILQPCSAFGKLIPEGISGTLLTNGIWVGCVADVYYGVSDIAIAVSPSIDRMKVVQFTSSIRYTVLTYVTHKPKAFYAWTSIFYAFGPFAWATIFISI